ncbi:twin transmembrane helix small protein [Hydrogenophaga sp. 5NK40-0174]|uniref:twin transmembrane helix small protein n=1 Tax=Hydrogenophaga sp. 5NK40-0174 TaxID=3127649 RepID=UPI00333F28C0
MKYLVILAFIAIIGSLVTALVLMMRGGQTAEDSTESSAPPRRKGNMATALAFRVGFSILLFLIVLLSYWMGWIEPTGIKPGQ